MPDFKKHSNERIHLPTHKPPEEDKEQTPLEYQVYKLRQTRRMRELCKLMITRFPICIYYECDGRSPSMEAHHIRGLATHPELAYNQDNIVPLCSTCHSVIEGKERRGIRTYDLFKGWTGKRTDLH